MKKIIAIAAVLLLAASVFAQKVLKVGATPEPHADILNLIKDDLKEQGIDLQVIEMTDYPTLNEVLEAGDIDANYDQHIPYMESFNKEKGFHLVNAGGIHVEPFAVKSVFTDSSVEYSNNSKNLSKRMFSETTAESLKEMMRYTMKNQYKDSMFGGIQMCAKTGTAEVGGDKFPHGWMVGFSYDKTFPVAFSVVVENGDFGIRSAGPIAVEMIKDLHGAFNSGKYEKK